MELSVRRVVPCLFCGTPVTAHYVLSTDSWEMVHGEMPLIGWKNEQWDLRCDDDMRGLWDWCAALDGVH